MVDELQAIDEAKSLLDSNSAFITSVAKLRKMWFNELMGLDSAAPYYNQQVMALTCKMQALEAIPRELALLLKNFHLDQQRRSTPSTQRKERAPGEIPDY
jgi:hypothetical protein